MFLHHIFVRLAFLECVEYKTLVGCGEINVWEEGPI